MEKHLLYYGKKFFHDEKNLLLWVIQNVYAISGEDVRLFQDVDEVKKDRHGNIVKTHDDSEHDTPHGILVPIEYRLEVINYPTTGVGGRILSVNFDRPEPFYTTRWGTEVEEIHGENISEQLADKEDIYDEVRNTRAITEEKDFNAMMKRLKKGGFLITHRDVAIRSEEGKLYTINSFAEDGGYLVLEDNKFSNYSFIKNKVSSSFGGCGF